MTMACSGIPLTDTATRLMARVKRNPSDAYALMDLAIISHLWFKHDIGLATQAQALRLSRHYRLPARGVATVRLLALMLGLVLLIPLPSDGGGNHRHDNGADQITIHRV